MIKTYRDGRQKRTGVDYTDAKKEKWLEQGKFCAICNLYVPFEMSDCDHIKTRGMGGAWHDDRAINLRIVHRSCHFKRHYRERDAAGWTKKVNSIVEWAEKQ